MVFVIGLLTLAMVLDCFALVFLVLIQLPKKEAGAGLAFGGAATDALFGAGSGTVLTKVTKYAAGIFFGLAILLSVLGSASHRRSGSQFRNLLQQPGKPPIGSTAPAAPTPGPANPAAAPAAKPNTNLTLTSTPQAEATNQSPAQAAPAPATTTSTNK